MLQIAQLFADDPNLGHVDYSSFSDQTLMELLISELPDVTKQNFQDRDGTFLDVCEWSCVKCDDEERVTRVDGASEIPGTIQLSYIPENVLFFRMCGSKLHGTLDANRLPRGLERIFLTTNKLEGAVDFTALPTQAEYFSVAVNSLSGSVDLGSLPGKLRRLWIQQNRFNGTLCLTKLPLVMDILDISENVFSGDFHFVHIAGAYPHINAESNRFCPIAVVGEGGFVCFEMSGVTSVVDGNRNTHSKEAEMLRSEEENLYEFG